MSALVVAHPVGAAAYGAEELKRAAHRNMFVALSLSIFLHFSIIGSYYLSAVLGHDDIRPVTPGCPLYVDFGTHVLPIPGIAELPPPGGPVPHRVAGGTPVPVADAPEVRDNTISSQDVLKGMVDPGVSGFPTGVGEVPSIVIDDVAPPDTFFSVEQLPVVVRSVVPVYPELALRAGLEGRVFVKMWVDRQGKVRSAEVVKSNNDIFNDAAMEAARQFVFTPAYMNSGPVSVWVISPFTFRLAERK